jgi:hypothetical protein
VLKPGGVLALWGYGRLPLPHGMDEIFERFYSKTIGPYWPPERKLIDDGYRSLDIPFAEFTPLEFIIEVEWNLPRLLDYLSTWSGVKRFIQAIGTDPLSALATELAPLWGETQRYVYLKWPLYAYRREFLLTFTRMRQ